MKIFARRMAPPEAAPRNLWLKVSAAYGSVKASAMELFMWRVNQKKKKQVKKLRFSTTNIKQINILFKTEQRCYQQNLNIIIIQFLLLFIQLTSYTEEVKLLNNKYFLFKTNIIIIKDNYKVYIT